MWILDTDSVLGGITYSRMHFPNSLQVISNCQNASYIGMFN